MVTHCKVTSSQINMKKSRLSVLQYLGLVILYATSVLGVTKQAWLLEHSFQFFLLCLFGH